MADKVPASLAEIQDRIAAVLGRPPEKRAELVAASLSRDRNDVTAYWLQLLVAAGIATLGLVLGSTAAVIGAMLIAPLMEPILNLGLGLAIGSPFLVLRSVARVASSVLVVVGGSALVVWLLPFHEVNSEIAARIAPTALDLFIAAFCAVAGVYASLRGSSDVATTAAGTSIGISLVPPLCASGFGVGTGLWPIAGGALLLFLTNFAAIIFVASLGFVAAGMNRVQVAKLEREALAEGGPAKISRLIARRLGRVFASGGGTILRFAMPVVLLATLYVPLREALDEVTWQVRVRSSVEQALKGLENSLVEKRIRVERGIVEIALILIAAPEDLERIRSDLAVKIRSAAGSDPKIELHAVPDAATVAGLASLLREPKAVVTPPPEPPDPIESFDLARVALRDLLDRHWPQKAAGEILAAKIDLGSAAIDLELTHHGEALGAGAIEALERSLSQETKRSVRIATRAIPRDPIRATELDAPLIARIASLLEASGGLALCVAEPREKKRRSRAEAEQQERHRALLHSALARHSNVSITDSEAWSFTFSGMPCAGTSTAARTSTAGAQ